MTCSERHAKPRPTAVAVRLLDCATLPAPSRLVLVRKLIVVASLVDSRSPAHDSTRAAKGAQSRFNASHASTIDVSTRTGTHITILITIIITIASEGVEDEVGPLKSLLDDLYYEETCKRAAISERAAIQLANRQDTMPKNADVRTHGRL